MPHFSGLAAPVVARERRTDTAMKRTDNRLGWTARALAVGGCAWVFVVVGLGCSSQVGRDCLPAGTHVDFDAGVGTVTARICFGADRQT